MMNSRILVLIAIMTLFVDCFARGMHDGSRLLLQQDLDICVGSHGRMAGGLYSYSGDFNGKPYYKQKECIRSYDDGAGDIVISGFNYLYYLDNKYHLSNELGSIQSTLRGFKAICETVGISSPLECENWIGNGGTVIHAIFNGECPNVFGNDINADELYKGVKVELKNEELQEGQVVADLNGDYNIKLGLNMFKKSLSTTPVYLYFDPYWYNWRFITSFDKGDDLWSTNYNKNAERESCPAYSAFTVISVQQKFEQFTVNKLSQTISLSNGGVMTLTALPVITAV